MKPTRRDRKLAIIDLENQFKELKIKYDEEEDTGKKELYGFYLAIINTTLKRITSKNRA
jgi:hypothetical protein